MKNKREKIDNLLITNTDSQLARVNWLNLNSSISDSLDKASRKPSPKPKMHKIFAATATAAAVLLAVLILNPYSTKGPAIAPGQNAAVEFPPTNTTETVISTNNTSAASAIVELASTSTPAAQVTFACDTCPDVICELEIFDSNATMEKITDRPSWIIINLHRPSVAEAQNQNGDEELFWMM